MNKANIKNILVNISLSIFVIAALFFIFEFVVRALYTDEIVLFPRYHTDAQYGNFTLRKIRPNSKFWHTSIDGKWEFQINNQGFRNYKDFEYERHEGVIRVLSLGDSHTQGFEVHQDYTFSAIMEKYFNSRGFNAEVINTGISGFSTAEELVFLENEGIKYKPDFVVLGFFANDYEDNVKADLFKLNDDGSLAIQKRKHIPGVKIQNLIYSFPFVKWLGENSYTYSILFNTTWNYFKTRLSKTASNRSIEYAVAMQDKPSNYQVALTSALLLRMYNFCKTNSISFIVLDIPRRAENNITKTSLDATLSMNIENHCDEFISSETLLSEYQHVSEMHKPNGHRHISEFTHTILGVNVAKEIIKLNR